MLLVNWPVPVPFEVFESETVGFDDVLQQTPLAVTEALPSELISPPLVAEVEVMLEAVVVVNVGSVAISVFVQLLIKSNTPIITTGKNILFIILH
jgi:hypothetical protein